MANEYVLTLTYSYVRVASQTYVLQHIYRIYLYLYLHKIKLCLNNVRKVWMILK